MSGNRQNTQQGDEGLVAAFCETVVDSAMGVLKHAETYNLRKAMGIEELRAEILDA